MNVSLYAKYMLSALFVAVSVCLARDAGVLPWTYVKVFQPKSKQKNILVGHTVGLFGEWTDFGGKAEKLETSEGTAAREFAEKTTGAFFTKEETLKEVANNGIKIANDRLRYDTFLLPVPWHDHDFLTLRLGYHKKAHGIFGRKLAMDDFAWVPVANLLQAIRTAYFSTEDPKKRTLNVKVQTLDNREITLSPNLVERLQTQAGTQALSNILLPPAEPAQAQVAPAPAPQQQPAAPRPAPVRHPMPEAPRPMPEPQRQPMPAAPAAASIQPIARLSSAQTAMAEAQRKVLEMTRRVQALREDEFRPDWVLEPAEEYLGSMHDQFKKFRQAPYVAGAYSRPSDEINMKYDQLQQLLALYEQTSQQIQEQLSGQEFEPAAPAFPPPAYQEVVAPSATYAPTYEPPSAPPYQEGPEAPLPTYEYASHQGAEPSATTPEEKK